MLDLEMLVQKHFHCLFVFNSVLFGPILVVCVLCEFWKYRIQLTSPFVLLGLVVVKGGEAYVEIRFDLPPVLCLMVDDFESR